MNDREDLKVPCLMLAYNRLPFLKKAVKSLLEMENIIPFILDDGSDEETKDWLKSIKMNGNTSRPRIFYSSENHGISLRFNTFLSLTESYPFVAKIDSDTICEKDWIARMMPHMKQADIVQSRHALLKETHPKGFDDWVKSMSQRGALRFHHFVGGSGVLMRRDVLSLLPETEWKLGGFRQWQRENPHVKKAFATDVTIHLLDTDENGANYPSEMKSYYSETKRL